MPKRNPYLTPAMERVLKWMIGSAGDGELVTEGREAWYGFNRTNIATVNALLRLCLLRDEGKDGAMGDESFRRYSVNEEARQIINDPKYIPLIVKYLKSRKE